MTRLVALLVLVCIAAGCAPTPAHESHASAASVASAARHEWSVYDLPSRWTDQTGTRRSLGALRGSPRVVAMVYTHCTSTCPTAITEMKRIEAETPANVGLVLVSLDPDRDTPERLAAYAVERGLTGARWTLLHGTESDVRELAAVLDIRYRRLSPVELAHANVITLLDADGAVVRQQKGLDGDDIAHAASALSTSLSRN